MKKTMLFGLTLGVAVLFSGCATILDGKTQKVNLESKKEFMVEIDGKTYKSPGIIELNRDDRDAILRIKECDKNILLKKEVNPTFFVNILSGGAFGSTTDYSSKAMWKYDQTNIQVHCE